MKNFKISKIISFCLSIIISVSTLPAMLTSYAAGDTDNISNTTVESEIGSYSEYYSRNKDFSMSKNDVSVNFTESESFDYSDVISCNFTVSESAFYELSAEYLSLSTRNIVFEVEIDGASPFSEAENITFPTYFVNENEDWKDKEGNQFTPEQVVSSDYVKCLAYDYSGKTELPYKFALNSGEHTLSLKVLSGNFKLKTITFTAPDSPGAYKQPTINSAVNAEPIIIEGESAVIKNDRALIPMSDNATPVVHPASVTEVKLNYIGGSNWGSPGQTIYWDVDVDKAGYYSLGIQYRQSYVTGGVSYRHLGIDGETPFSEAQRIKFPYSKSWDYFTYENSNGDPYYIYLSEGKHTLSLTTTAGEFCTLYAAMQEVTAFMGDIYVDITKVVGETVDIYRSYELFNQIPNFNKRLELTATNLEKISSYMVTLQNNSTSSSVSIVNDAVRVIREMINNPYSAHKYKSQFYDAYTNLSAILSDMVNMPLDIDRIVLSGASSKYEYNSTDVSLFEKTSFALKRFFTTFTNDYNTISDGTNKNKGLTIWINWGRDQAEALNSIIQSDFVSNYEIPVSVKLVNASMIQAILSGKGPDCLVQMSRTEPVNLAMRGALVDLKQFDDFDEITTRFNTGATLPYTYRDGVYALPVTQAFYLMYIRTDILNNLGIEIPQTWDEFIAAASILQRNNLEAIIPYTQLSDSGTVNAGVGGLSLFPTLLIQKGLSLYNAEGSTTTLLNTQTIQTFVDWTKLYTEYKFHEITNFYNRFRIGSAPIGIAAYTLYTQLKAAAPELEGRWTVSMIPGTQKEDGTIDHSSASWGAGCAITKLSKNPENAWKFLKWWTSSKIQLKYSNMLESVLGPLGRVDTANLDAFSQMDWDVDMYASMTDQKNNVVEIPEIPGGYYTARGIDQALWNVVEAGKDPTEMIKKWGATVDAEITRKKTEYEP